MTSSLLSPLIGQKVVAAEVFHDYLHSRFDTGDVLNICKKPDLQGCAPSEVKALMGLPVSAVSDQPEAVRLQVGEMKVSVSLLDGVFQGPEAIQYTPASGKCVLRA